MKLSFNEWFKNANPDPEEIKARWEAIGGIPIPKKVWAKICDEFDGLETWDTLVECARPKFDEDNNYLGEEPYLTDEMQSIVIALDYYGKPVKKEDAAILAGLKPWKRTHYSIVVDGIDGKSEEKFNALELARPYVEGRVGTLGYWTSSDTCFHNDFCHFYLHGFSLSDLGINWIDHAA